MPLRIAILIALLAALVCAQEKIPVRQETVVVTGSFEPVPLEEADRAVTMLDTREAPLLYRSWADYLPLESSLDLRHRAPAGMQADLSIRGASFGQALVLVNGLRVNDAQSGHHNLDLPFPLQSLQRIEVLRGAGSTLYGSDALGGAVNFITSPADATEFRAGAAVGNFGVNQQFGAATYSAKRFSQQLSFCRDFSAGFRPDRDYRAFTSASQTRFGSALGVSSLLLAYSDRPFGADQFYGHFNSWERTKAWLAAASQELGPKTQAAFGYRRHTDIFVLFRDRPQVFTNDHATESWQAALRRRESLSQNARLFYGGELYRDSIDSTNLGRHVRNRGALYADFDMRALRRFSFSAGLRNEIYAGARQEFSPTASAGVWAASWLKLRVSASRAFRLPTYTDLYYHDPATSGSPTLRPESAWSYEAGLDWHAGKVSGAATVFHRRERDGIDYVRASASQIWRAANIQSLHFTGFESSVRVHLARVQRLDFAYTGLHGGQEALGNMLSRYVFNYPTHNGSLGWQGMLPGRLSGRTRVGVTQRRARDAYAIWDISLSREFRRLRPFAQFSNISDTQYEEIPGVVMPGRSAVLGVEIGFNKKKK